MEKFQSNSFELYKNLERIYKAGGGEYEFFWAHPIKIPKKPAKHAKIEIFDRSKGDWIPIEPCSSVPPMNSFKEFNISFNPAEPDIFFIIGSCNVKIVWDGGSWTVYIDVID